MTKYTCPICDRSMNGRHYCSFCRQFVKNPYLSKVDYLLNEQHPLDEQNCDYHDRPVKPQAGRRTQTAPAKHVAPAGKTPVSQGREPQERRTFTPARQRSQVPSNNIGSIIAAIIGIMALINLSSCFLFI